MSAVESGSHENRQLELQWRFKEKYPERSLQCSAARIEMSERDMELSDHIPLFVAPGVRRVNPPEGCE